MASIFMQGIPYHWRKPDVVRYIADLLHDYPLRKPNGPKPNFSVHLHADPDQEGQHRGQGTLTLPSRTVGRNFLSLYRQLVVDGSLLTFRPDRFSPNLDVLQIIQNTPYIDPTVEEAYQQRAEALSDVVLIASLQLGRRCRDNVFSIEWDAGRHFGSDPIVTFKADTNELWFALGEPPQGRERVIVSKLSRIEGIAIIGRQASQPSLLITFASPPALEAHDQLRCRDKPFRHRLSSFDPAHSPIAAFVGLALHVVCCSKNDLGRFLKMASAAHLPPPVDLTAAPIARGVFSVPTLSCLNKHIGTLEWPVAFQCEALLSGLWIDPTEFQGLMPRISTLATELGPHTAAKALQLFAGRLRTSSFNATGIQENLADSLTYAASLAKEQPDSAQRAPSDLSFFNCYHATVTPTRVILDGPLIDQTNRVIRSYYDHHHCFLRVNFTDEESLGYRWDRDVDGPEFVKHRVGGVLKNGLTIAGRKFEFLAYSSSALKEHAVWFLSPFYDRNGRYINAQTIRAGLGNFAQLVFQPAKYGARMAQAFTATEASVTLPDVDEIQILPDIANERFTFTDGLGVISPKLASRISKALQSRPGSKKRFFIEPSAYQFRMGGFKGVVFVDYGLQGKDVDILLRRSQQKFSSPSTDLEIAQPFFRAKPFFLNRFLIMVLETLGVNSDVFIKLQDEAVADVEAAAESMQSCADFLDTHGCGTSYRLSSVFTNFVKYGIDWKGRNAKYPLDDQFLFRAVGFAKNHVLRIIKHKARIPVKNCYTFVGIADTYGYLKENEVYICVRRNSEERAFCLRGSVLVTRSPQVNPGDVQYVHAVGRVPDDVNWPLRWTTNCIVFSTQGERDVPSMLAGGDLDGDEYNIITERGLFPPTCEPPAEYPPVPARRLDHPCGAEDLADWVVDYINNDILGFIADQHLQLADQRPDMACDEDCIRLAALASKAVDFAKSGTPVDRREMPPPPLYRPDWAAGELGRNRGARVYESQRAVGKLFRRIDLSKTEWTTFDEAKRPHEGRKDAQIGNDVTPQMGTPTVHTCHPITQALTPAIQKRIDISKPVPQAVLHLVLREFAVYEADLRCICAGCTLSTRHPLSEEEVLMGTIIAKTSQPARRKSQMSQLRMQTDTLVKRVRRELGGDEENESLADGLYKSWIAWQVAVHRGNVFGANSYGIIAVGSILECLKKFEEEDVATEQSKRSGR